MMSKKSLIISVIIFSISVISVSVISAYAQEEKITITTYYPSPYGSYKELRADQMAIGSAYRTAALSDGNLLVSGKVGIGTAAPRAKLEIAGGDNTDLIALPGEVKLTYRELAGSLYGFNLPAGADNSFFLHTEEGGCHQVLYFGDGYEGSVGGNIFGISSRTPSVPGNADWNAKFVVNQDGNVGIGTTGPGAKLDIVQPLSGSNFGLRVHASSVVDNPGPPYGPLSNFYPNAAGIFSWTQMAPAVYGYSLNRAGVYGHSWAGVGVYGQSSSGPAGVFMGGNVGIGTVNPAQKLEIAGAIKIGNANTPVAAGTIRWNGSNFQGYDGTKWVNLDDSSQSGLYGWCIEGPSRRSISPAFYDPGGSCSCPDGYDRIILGSAYFSSPVAGTYYYYSCIKE